jgi:hypothetical protein
MEMLLCRLRETGLLNPTASPREIYIYIYMIDREPSQVPQSSSWPATKKELWWPIEETIQYIWERKKAWFFKTKRQRQGLLFYCCNFPETVCSTVAHTSCRLLLSHKQTASWSAIKATFYSGEPQTVTLTSNHKAWGPLQRCPQTHIALHSHLSFNLTLPHSNPPIMP